MRLVNIYRKKEVDKTTENLRNPYWRFKNLTMEEDERICIPEPKDYNWRIHFLVQWDKENMKEIRRLAKEEDIEDFVSLQCPKMTGW